MPAINIEEKKTILVTDTNGRPINEGDLLLIRATTQETILCYYKKVNQGYFYTEAFTDNAPVKYRLKSLKFVTKIEEVIEEKGE